MSWAAEPSINMSRQIWQFVTPSWPPIVQTVTNLALSTSPKYFKNRSTCTSPPRPSWSLEALRGNHRTLLKEWMHNKTLAFSWWVLKVTRRQREQIYIAGRNWNHSFIFFRDLARKLKHKNWNISITMHLRHSGLGRSVICVTSRYPTCLPLSRTVTNP